MGSVTPLAASALPEVTGYVEAFTADRVIGWAWGPRAPGQRASIELRLGDDVVADAIAEQPRADLAASGIGDGKHAFEMTVPEVCRTRLAELQVFARIGQGTPVAIGAPPQAEAVSDQLGRVRVGIETLVGSQRVLHRTLQAALASRTEPASDAPALAKLTETQTVMAQQLASVERFVVRLDEQLAMLASPATARHHAVPPAAWWALGVAGTALLVSVFGLVHSLGG